MKKGFTQPQFMQRNKNDADELIDRGEIATHGKWEKTGAGFTLIELMIVIAIMGVLIAVGLTSFRTSQMRARDSRRKNDLRQIASALEYYYNDKRGYPASDASNNYNMLACGSNATALCEWGKPTLSMGDSDKNTIYMVKIPADPSSGRSYRYEGGGSSYKLYASLEMGLQDIDYNSSISVTCGSATCNYGVSSSNTTP